VSSRPERGRILDEFASVSAPFTASTRCGLLRDGRPPRAARRATSPARALMNEGNLPVRDVAKPMGVSVATLYRHVGKRGTRRRCPGCLRRAWLTARSAEKTVSRGQHSGRPSDYRRQDQSQWVSSGERPPGSTSWALSSGPFSLRSAPFQDFRTALLPGHHPS